MDNIVWGRGDHVRVVAADGTILTRRVVAVERGRVYVCTNDEFCVAKREGREPVAVGFLPESVQRE